MRIVHDATTNKMITGAASWNVRPRSKRPERSRRAWGGAVLLAVLVGVLALPNPVAAALPGVLTSVAASPPPVAYGPDLTIPIEFATPSSQVQPLLVTHLTITPTFDSSITSDPNAATIEATINAAIQAIENNYSDPITVNITFKKDTTISLGGSSTFITTVTYTDYRAALIAHSTTPDDTSALATLPVGPGNPVNAGTSVTIRTANARALGFSAAIATDSTISLNTPICNLDRSVINPNKYDLLAVTMHEIDEALAFGSALNNHNNGDPAPAVIQADDLFRYDQTGARSYNTLLATQAFFSIDAGPTKLARFNQTQGGDFSDWYSPGGQIPQVQDAFATLGATPNLGVELRRLDVLGYSRTGVCPAECNTAGCNTVKSQTVLPPDTGNAFDVFVNLKTTCGTNVLKSCQATFKRAAGVSTDMVQKCQLLVDAINAQPSCQLAGYTASGTCVANQSFTVTDTACTGSVLAIGISNDPAIFNQESDNPGAHPIPDYEGDLLTPSCASSGQGRFSTDPIHAITLAGPATRIKIVAAEPSSSIELIARPSRGGPDITIEMLTQPGQTSTDIANGLGQRLANAPCPGIASRVAVAGRTLMIAADFDGDGVADPVAIATNDTGLRFSNDSAPRFLFGSAVPIGCIPECPVFSGAGAVAFTLLLGATGAALVYKYRSDPTPGSRRVT